MKKHFDKDDPLSHILKKKIEGTLLVSEAHGIEMPGHLGAASDAIRETAMALLFVWLFLALLDILAGPILTAFGLGWIAWKTGRSAWLGWARLERLHKVIEQEKYEIEHHRPQEREELVALYEAKGFEGKLLEDVVDVLMADQDRLLKVMLEEEMGFTLQAYEHPLKQCLGAAVGSIVALAVGLLVFFLLPSYGMLIASFLLLMASAVISALYEKNRIIPAVVWNLSIGALAFGIAYFMFQIIL